MVQNPVNIALILLEAILLTLPILAIFIQAMLSFYRETGPPDESYTGIHGLLMRRRFDMAFGCGILLFLAAAIVLFFLYSYATLPHLLDLAIVVILVAISLLSLLISAIVKDAQTVIYND